MKYRFWVLLTMLTAALAGALLAQDLPFFPGKVEHADEDAVLKSRVDLVNVAAAVRGNHNVLVRDLKAEDFHLFEDGKEQKITAFSYDPNTPITLGLMIDMADSIATRWYTYEQRALQPFLGRVIQPGDHGLIAGFRTDTELFSDFTGNVGQLQQCLLRRPTPVFEETRRMLFDAVQLVADKRLAKAAGLKVMIVLSDFVDNASRHKLEEAVEAAQEADTVVYGIAFPLNFTGIFSSGSGMYSAGATPPRPSASSCNNECIPAAETAARRHATMLTEQTSGRLFKVPGGGTDSDLSHILKQIEEELRARYLISYVSSNAAHEGKYRKIEIKLANKDYKVVARQGYWAPKQ